MGKRLRFLCFSSSIWLMAVALVLLSFAGLTMATTGVLNKSASTDIPFWPTLKEEGDSILKWQASDDDFTEPTTISGNDDDSIQVDGGFSSLDGMLQWAIGHSDPTKLKDTAEGTQGLSSDELMQRQTEIKELVEKLKMPSDSKLMKIAIDQLNNSTLSSEDHLGALQELLILVEPIDNANDFPKLGGLVAVVKHLDNPNSAIRTISTWILGKASQNNPIVQNQILELEALSKLMELARSDYIEEATKALYTISSLIRSNIAGQELFYREAGDLMLQDIISNSSIDIRLRRKSVLLVADLVKCQLNHGINGIRPFFSDHSFLKSVVDLMTSADLDLQEKVLYAIKDLLLLESSNSLVFKEVCQLDVVLGQMRRQLRQLIVDDNFGEYARDVETLLAEVELIFLQKLGNVRRNIDSA